MTYAVELQGITKIYPENNLKANSEISLDIRKGEILCLAGENGAGKTTLMKILYGLEDATEGSIKVNGKEVSINSPLDANRLGIGMVHQHFMLFPEFTVAQNVVMGIEPRKHGIRYDIKSAEERVNAVIKEHHFSIDASTPVKQLTVGQKQQVEILKMLYRDVEVLILDEPTAVLTEQEITSIFATFKALAQSGKSLILITHKLHEIKAISNRVAIMRKGHLIDVQDTCNLDEFEISRLMVGKGIELNTEKRRSAVQGSPAVITFDSVRVERRGQERPLLNNISFSAHGGEILGFAGVGGNGLGELEAVLGGFIPIKSGRILWHEEDITQFDTARLRKQGLAHVPADRLRLGSALSASVAENIIINKRKQFTKSGLLDRKAIHTFSSELISRFDVAGSPSMRIGSLSGGNIQKVILAREIDQYQDYIVFSEPTWGLDVASSYYVYEQMFNLREQGAAIILISSNLDEILAVSDRIIVLYRGNIAAVLDNTHDRELSKEEIGEYMLGLKTQSREVADAT